MSIFSDIPIRSNADTGMVDASWWNTIRTALIAWAGSGAVDQSQFTILDNQTAYVDITSVSLNHSVSRAYEFAYTIYRDDGTTSRREFGRMQVMYKAREGTWYYERVSYGDDALGNGTVSDPLRFSSSGVLGYKSDTFAAGTIRIQSVATFAKET